MTRHKTQSYPCKGKTRSWQYFIVWWKISQKVLPAFFRLVAISLCWAIGKRMSDWTPITITGHLTRLNAESMSPNVSPRSNRSKACENEKCFISQHDSPKKFQWKWINWHIAGGVSSLALARIVWLSGRNILTLKDSAKFGAIGP